MKTTTILTVLLAVALGVPSLVHAFCGFYVAKAETGLFNQASKVVIVRDGNRTVLTMSNDFKGEPREFAMVIPVPTFLEKDQIHVGNSAVIDHLDAYTAPRLVEYFDEDPCRPPIMMLEAARGAVDAAAAPMGGAKDVDEDLGVTVEAEYAIGEYDILILSAEESDGLETWLRNNEYNIPEGASQVLESYIKQEMRFFVAKVNLEEQASLGYETLRPLQVAYESPKFSLPIRLGTLNADGDQELFAFIITRNGRVETTNYRTVKLPSDMEIPVFVKDDFAEFYVDMFEHQVAKEEGKAVFMEYAWNMAWCDPCAADPLSREELADLGVFWLDDAGEQPQRRFGGGAQEAFVTRLHVRYNAETFPEDLAFQQTRDNSNFQGRYVLRHRWNGRGDCAAARRYWKELGGRMEQRADNLVELTGWDKAEVLERMELPEQVEVSAEDDEKWWQRLWKD